MIAELIKFYETGDLKTFDEYAILWVKDLNSLVDFVNGFTESYGDPLGMKASWESLVNFKDMELRIVLRLSVAMRNGLKIILR